MILRNLVPAQVQWDIPNKHWSPANNGDTHEMMLDGQRTLPPEKKAIALWRPQLQRRYPHPRRWTAIITLSLSLGPSHHSVTTTVALMLKGHRLGLHIPQSTTQPRPQSITEQRKEIRGALFSPLKYPPTCQRLPSMADHPLRISTRPESTKTGK